ncbi:DUF4435 domain-containing protein [Gluconobacter wancherniae]|uniref:DUF4435 domain-containing protein n=1 Tax=Gluconobacter wancherniae TaxID=1307955 RepID=UPI001B8B8BD3|nr:DUF4435 domain-containing protein [Gluconobacter wancherniae]MBS1063658.1 DUF4435 domain-containing protein [Gluconobacter wancherniae]
MSDYADELIAEQDNTNALLLEILVSGYEEWDYLFAVEGVVDKKFYYDFIHASLADFEIQLLDCGGKPKLLEFKKAIDDYPWVNPPKFRFICDKDFDDYLQIDHPGVWKTQWYSIESYLTQPEYIEYNVAKLATGKLPPAKRREFVDRYRENFLIMAKAVRPYCAFICEVRANKEHPQFDTFGIDALFHLAEPNAPRKAGILKDAVKTLQVNKPVKYSDILGRAKSFNISEMWKWLRGKLALQIARKSYELALYATPESYRTVLPPATFLGGDALGTAFIFWQSLPGLEDYCKN